MIRFGAMSMMMTSIGFDSPHYWSAVKLRDEVLRKPLGLALDAADIAADAAAHHFCTLSSTQVVACASLFSLDKETVRLRQMAVTAGLQRQNVGSQLLIYVEGWAREHGIATIVLHARLPAVPFYERHGYASEGEVFEEVTIAHRLMRKRVGLHTVPFPTSGDRGV